MIKTVFLRCFLFVWIMLTVVMPLTNFTSGFGGGFEGDFRFAPFDPSVLETLRFSLVLSFVALALSLGVSIPLSAFLSRTQRSRIHQMIEVLFEATWLLPSFAVVLGVIFLLRGLGITSVYSPYSVLIAWCGVGIPFLSIQLLRARRDLDFHTRDALRCLGANSIQLWWKFDLPQMKATLWHSIQHQLWLYLTSFTLVVLLNGGPPHETLEVAIYHSLQQGKAQQGLLVSLAFWQCLILIALRGWIGFQNSTTNLKTQGTFRVPSSETRIYWMRVGVLVSSLLVGWFLLKGNSFSGLVTAWWQGVALAVAVVLSLALVGGTIYISGYRWVAELGAWVSPMVLAMLWWKAYRFNVSSILVCIVIQCFLFLPWVSRVIFPILDRKRACMLEATQALGAGPWRAWWMVEWPRIRPSVIWCGILIFAFSLAEVSAVILFTDSQFQTLATWTQNQMSRFHIDAGGVGTGVMMLTSFAVLLTFRSRYE